MADDPQDAVVEPEPVVAEDPVDTSDRLQTVAEATAEEAREKAQELREAQETDDPNDDIAAARPEEGTAVAVPEAVVEVDEPDEPTVKLQLADSFKVPVLEEYTDEQGRPRGRVAGYEAPEDVRIAVASYDPDEDSDWVDEDGYVVLDSVVEVPKHIAVQITGNPAVEVVD